MVSWPSSRVPGVQHVHAGSVTFKSRSIHNFGFFVSAPPMHSRASPPARSARRLDGLAILLFKTSVGDFHSKLRMLVATVSRVTDQFVCPCSAASPTACAPPNALSEPRKKNTATRHVFAILVLDERCSFSKTGHRLIGYQPGHVTRVSMCQIVQKYVSTLVTIQRCLLGHLIVYPETRHTRLVPALPHPSWCRKRV